MCVKCNSGTQFHSRITKIVGQKSRTQNRESHENHNFDGFYLFLTQAEGKNFVIDQNCGSNINTDQRIQCDYSGSGIYSAHSLFQNIARITFTRFDESTLVVNKNFITEFGYACGRKYCSPLRWLFFRQN